MKNDTVQLSKQVIYLSIDNLPDYFPKRMLITAQEIKIYLQMVIQELQNKDKFYLMLPSVTELANYFLSHEFAVIDALSLLRKEGYRYYADSIDQSIMIYTHERYRAFINFVPRAQWLRQLKFQLKKISDTFSKGVYSKQSSPFALSHSKIGA